VCTFGILARLRDRAADQKSLAALHRSNQPKDGPANQGSEQALKSGGSGTSAD